MTCSGSCGAGPRWYVYLLRCADGTLYTGTSVDPERRLRQHNGELRGGARYTRARRPVVLLWVEPVCCRAAAQAREAAVRRLRRSAKLRLAARDSALAGL